MRTFFLLFIYFTYGSISAQVVHSPAAVEFLEIDGRVKVKNGPEDHVLVLAMRDGVPIDFTPQDVRKMQARLQLRRTYLLSFQKSGYLSKDLLFDTHVPFAYLDKAPFGFPFDVILEPRPADTTVRYAGPVGFVYFSEEKVDFVYIKDYTLIGDRAIRKRLQKAIKQQRKFVRKTVDSWVNIEQQLLQDRSSEPLGDIQTRSTFFTSRQFTEFSPKEPSDTIEDLLPIVRESVENDGESERKSADEDSSESMGADMRKKYVKADEADPETNPEKKGSLRKKNRAKEKPSAHSGPDRPLFSAPQKGSLEQGRTENLIVEKLRVTTIITITDDESSTEYRRVAHAYGPVFHFENGRPISKAQFDRSVGR